MDDAEIQTALSHLDKELHRFIDPIGEIPYIALPPEKSHVICFCPKIKKLCGYDADTIMADKEHWQNIIHPCDRNRVFSAFARCKNEGTPFNIGYRIVHKNGPVQYVNDKGEPVFDDRDKISQIEGTITPLRVITKSESIPLLEFKRTTTPNNVNANCFQKVS